MTARSLPRPDAQRPSRRRRRLLVGSVGALALSVGLAAASVVEYPDADLRFVLEVAPDQTVNYRVPIEVERMGTLVVEANWPGTRVLSFRLDPPSGAGAIRRSGPSPQGLSVEVPEGATGRWMLTIHGLASGGGGTGRLGIRLPPPPDSGSAPPVAVVEPPPDDSGRAPDLDRLPEAWRPFVRAASEFDRLVAGQSLPDACRWQHAFAGWSLAWSERLAEGGARPKDETRETLSRMAGVIRDVETLLDPSDPILTNPPVNDPAELQSWLSRRSARLESVRDGLDEVAAALERGHAPDLELESWPVALVSCVTACERHFEDRARVGAERAVNLRIAETQWDRLLIAARILELLADLPERPPRP
jgi:hypothetical protein